MRGTEKTRKSSKLSRRQLLFLDISMYLLLESGLYLGMSLMPDFISSRYCWSPTISHCFSSTKALVMKISLMIPSYYC